jgi:hypothetical protein
MRKPLLSLAALCAMLLMPLSPQAQVQAANANTDARVIVKYKADLSWLRNKALPAATQHALRAEALGKRMGLDLRAGAGLAEHAHLLFAGSARRMP